MLIIVDDLPKEPRDMSGTVELVLRDGACKDGLLISEPVAYKFEVLKQDSGVRVEGIVQPVC